jgi:cytochrome c oxidase subunit IV
MATPTHGTAGHHDDGAVHSHVSSVFFYAAVFGALLFLTVLTVGQSYVDLGRFNLVMVILIASLKASLVVSFFMHLRWDNKFNILIFISTLFFIGVFFAYTMNDTERRGELDADQNVRFDPRTGEEAPGGVQKKQVGDTSGDHGTDTPQENPSPEPGGNPPPAQKH